jgi:RecB family endonuclease NucS
VREEAFKSWLAQAHAENTVKTALYRLKKVEIDYGDLDKIYDEGKFDELDLSLTYSKSDENLGKPNPSKIELTSRVRETLTELRTSARKYRSFREQEADDTTEAAIEIAGQIIKERREGRTFELEVHLQRFLREEIEQLEPGLKIVDGGSERSVTSGEIDILAIDSEGQFVVIELKRDLARRETIGQIMGYVGDIMDEEATTAVRGIIVAGDFDKSCRSTLLAIPSLSLKRYRYNFQFDTVEKD